MQSYDLIMLVIIVGTTIFGAYKGLAWQVASLAAIFVSYFVAYRFREPVAEMINATEPWNMFLAMLLLYVASSLAIWMAFRFVSEMIDRIKLKEFDRQIGALVGCAKGVLLCVIVTLFAVTLLGDTQRKTIVDSYSGYYISLLLDKAHVVMPTEVHEVLDPYIHKLDPNHGDGAPEGEDGNPGSNRNDRGPHLDNDFLGRFGKRFQDGSR